MLITIFLLVLIYSILGKPVDKLVDKLKTVNWSELYTKVWGDIKKYGKKAGRVACRPVLTFYYVVRREDITLPDKALIYGVILYIVSPIDLIPRRILHFLGIIDDAVVLAYVTNKIQKLVTPEIELKVEATLDEWFGYSLSKVN